MVGHPFKTDGRTDVSKFPPLFSAGREGGKELPSKFQPSLLLCLTVTSMQRMAREEAAAAKADDETGWSGRTHHEVSVCQI